MLGCEGWGKATLVFLVGMAGTAPGSALATNGFNFYAFGSEATGIGGADVAFVRDTSALVINPAGLGHIGAGDEEKPHRFDGQLDPYYLIDVRHRDSLDNDEQSKPRLGASGSMAYAQRVGDNFVVGAGAYVAGGLGFEYRGLDSGYGTRGEINTRFNVLRFAPGIAWDLQNGLTLGASLSVNYAMARQKEFADTSVFNLLDQQGSLFGSRIDGLRGFGLGGNFGLRYVLPPRADGLEQWTFGLAYRSRSKLDLKDGKLTVNYNALGAGRIPYHDVSLHGVVIPQDVQAGFQFRANKHWKLMGEVTWIDWSDAIQEFRLEASSPERNPLPLLIPNQIERRQTLEWRDQWVYAVGVMYEPYRRGWRVSAGFNYGRQPVPKRNLTPLVAALPEKHFSIGGGFDFLQNWEVNLAAVYIAKTTVDYENAATRITADAQESHETIAISLGISRSW